MSNEVNPYQSPEAPASPIQLQGLTVLMQMYLRQASPWLRFMGILGFIGVGFYIFGSIIATVLASSHGSTWANSSYYKLFSSSAGVVLGLFCGLIIFFPSLYSYRFGARIRSYLKEGNDEDLELALKNNKSFWKFCGIYSIICIITIILALVFVIGIAVFR